MTIPDAINFGEDRADLFGGEMEEFIKLSVATLKERQTIRTNIDELMKELEEIFSDIRERHVDDSVCGLCEYDCDHGLDGYANECPGFERDDCV